MKKTSLAVGILVGLLAITVLWLARMNASVVPVSPTTSLETESQDTADTTATTAVPETTIPTSTTNKDGLPVIYVSIVSHNEDMLSGQYPDFTKDQAEFERQREAVASFAAMLAKNQAKYDFQTEWNFLLGMQKYDKGTTSTNGKNLIAYLSEDLGMSVDPHSHEKLGYNYADVAYLISTFGVEPTGVVGGMIAAPPEDSILEYLWKPIEANKYDYTWTPEIGWGGGTGLHINETSLWTSGVWRAKDNEHYQEHDASAPLPIVGRYNSSWEGLDDLLEKQANGELKAGNIYTITIMQNQTWLTDQTIAEFETQLKTYADETADGRIVWATLPEVYEAWHTLYQEVPSILTWEGGTATSAGAEGIQPQKSSANTCGNGICEAFERKKGLCAEDC